MKSPSKSISGAKRAAFRVPPSNYWFKFLARIKSISHPFAQNRDFCGWDWPAIFE